MFALALGLVGVATLYGQIIRGPEDDCFTPTMVQTIPVVVIAFAGLVVAVIETVMLFRRGHPWFGVLGIFWCVGCVVLGFYAWFLSFFKICF